LYDTKSQHDDMDEKINRKILELTIQLQATNVAGTATAARAILPSPQQVTDFFDLLWDYFIEAHD
jgi:hypothetical protein